MLDRHEGRESNDGKLQTLNVDEEGSIPTLFSSLAMLLCAILAMMISPYCNEEAHRYRKLWRLLVVILLFMCLDEIASFHESLISPVRSALSVGGFFYFAWVIPGMALVLVLALVYLRFILHLPSKTRWLVAVASILSVWGALGMEMIGGYVIDLYGRTPIYVVITTVEESLEILGIVILIYALMRYMVNLEATQARQSTPISDKATYVDPS